jgi:hypothetical protein
VSVLQPKGSCDVFAVQNISNDFFVENGDCSLLPLSKSKMCKVASKDPKISFFNLLASKLATFYFKNSKNFHNFIGKIRRNFGIAFMG